MRDTRQRSVSDVLVVVFPLTLVIFFIFLARVVFSPLLVPMETELHLSCQSSRNYDSLSNIGQQQFLD